MAETFSPSVLTKGALSTFFEQLSGERASLIDRWATRVDSNADAENHPWLGEPPQMAEVVDEVVFTPMSDANYKLTNVTYAAGIQFPRRTVITDQTGGVSRRIQQMAVVAAMHPNKLLIQNLIDGDSATLGLDVTNEAYFNDTHAARGTLSSTQDNINVGTGTTTAQVSADFNAALAQGLDLLAENGEPFREEVTQIEVVAPPVLMKPMKEAVRAQVISQTTNVQFEGMTVGFTFTARISADDANDWYIGFSDSPVKPLIFQNLEALNFTSLDTDESELAFNAEVYRYKTRADYATGYALWQNAQKITNT